MEKDIEIEYIFNPDVEYITLIDNFWIARYLKKPSKLQIKMQSEAAKKSKYKIILGIHKNLIKEILKDYEKHKKNCYTIDMLNENLDSICAKHQLPKPIIQIAIQTQK